MTVPPQRTAVLLDPHPLWLDAVEQVLERIGTDVVGKATAPEQALSLVEAKQPDLLVSEIEMPIGQLDGLTTLSRAKEQVPNLRLVVLSMYADQAHINAALEVGANAYVIKTAHPDDLASAIRQAFDHSIYLAGARVGGMPSRAESVEEKVGLTKRELEILRLVSQGHSNVELAGMLWVTEQTVKFHLSNIYRKLDVSNRTEASHWAQVHGLLGTNQIQMSAA